MVDRDLYWLAGLLEGEGYFGFSVSANDNSRQFVLAVATTDEDVAERVGKLLGKAHTGPYSYKDGNKPYWRVNLSRRDDTLAWCRTLRPLMSVRRQQQIDVLLVADKEHPRRPRGPRRKGNT